jgi:hypothetical protein
LALSNALCAESNRAGGVAGYVVVAVVKEHGKHILLDYSIKAIGVEVTP